MISTSALSSLAIGQRRTLLGLALVAVFASAASAPRRASAAESATPSYEGISKVEVFTSMEVGATLPKDTPFELNVYRLDGYRRANEAMDRLTPKSLNGDARRAWQKKYEEEHPEFVRKWEGAAVESIKGMQIWRRHYSSRARGQVPAIVINGDWVMVGETNVDKAIARFQKGN